MNDQDIASFLAFRPNGNGELTVHTPDNKSFTFAGLDLEFISDICPLLAFSFEEGAKGRRLHMLNASSIELVSRFLRFLYTGNYHVLDNEGVELPCSLLMQAQLYHYGELYVVPHLMDAAYCRISELCELACSMPAPPVGLCETLRYLYLNVKDCQELHHTILHYCISCFNYHRLDENADFKKLLIDVKACELDLCKLNMERGFQDESSGNIIRMQLPNAPSQQRYSYDYLYDMFGGSNFSTPMQTPLLTPEMTPPISGFTLVHRPRGPNGLPATEDSDGYSSDGSLSNDLENFSLVGRPRVENRASFESFRSYNSTDALIPSRDIDEDSRTRGLNWLRNSDRREESGAGFQPNTTFGDDRRFGASRTSLGSHSASYHDAQEFALRPAAHSFTPVEGLGQSGAPKDETRDNEDSFDNPFEDPSDADHSDSEWSVVSDKTSPREASEVPARSVLFYMHSALAGSNETILAASDREESMDQDEEPEPERDVESSDSEWSVVSDGAPARVPP